MDFGLDEEQTEKLRQFQEITNIGDHEVAMCTLASLDWNVERAIEAHLMSDETVMDLPEEIRSRAVPAGIDLSSRRGLDVVDLVENDNLDVEPILIQKNRQAVRKTASDQTVDMDIVQPTSSYRNGHFRRDQDEEVLTDDDDDYPLGHDVEDIERTSNSHNYAVPLIPTECDCVEEALHNFVSVFEARFSVVGCHMPPFYTEPLPNAIKEAFETPIGGVEERRPLALYIHHDGSIAANIFPSKVLCSESVSSLLRCQYITWPWDITHKENEVKLREWLDLVGMLDIRRSLEVLARDKERFPVLVLITREKGVYNLIDICDGMDSTDTVIGKLMAGVDAFASIRLSEQAEENGRIERERIRQEQALEYEMSLAADKARMEQKEREIRAQKEEEEKKRREAEEQEIYRQILASELPDEPLEEDSEAIMVKFRLPEGEQLVRRFRKTERLSVLIKYLGAKGYSVDGFRLFNSDFPKKDVSTFDELKSFADLKWPVREQIFVEER